MHQHFYKLRIYLIYQKSQLPLNVILHQHRGFLSNKLKRRQVEGGSGGVGGVRGDEAQDGGGFRRGGAGSVFGSGSAGGRRALQRRSPENC